MAGWRHVGWIGDRGEQGEQGSEVCMKGLAFRCGHNLDRDEADEKQQERGEREEKGGNGKGTGR